MRGRFKQNTLIIPDQIDDLVREVFDYHNSNNFTRSLESCQTVLERDPTNVDAYYMRAWNNIQISDTTNSNNVKPYLKAIIDLHIAFILASITKRILEDIAGLVLGKLYHSFQLYNEAIEIYNDSSKAKQNPQMFLEDLERSQAQIKPSDTSKFNQEIQDCSKILKSNPTHLKTLYARAQYYEHDKKTKALVDYQIIVTLKEINKKININLSEDISNEEYMTCMLRVGLIYHNLNVFDEAKNSFNKAIENASPTDLFFSSIQKIKSRQDRIIIYQACLEDKSEFKESKENENGIFQLIQNELRRENSLVELAEIDKLFDDQNYQAALERSGRLIQSNPTCAEAYFSHGLNLMAQGTNDDRKIYYIKAAVNFHLMLILGSSNKKKLIGSAAVNLGRIYQSLGCFAEAVDICDAVSEFANDSDRECLREIKNQSEVKPADATASDGYLRLCNQRLKENPTHIETLYSRALFHDTDNPTKAIIDRLLVVALKDFNKATGVSTHKNDDLSEEVFINCVRDIGFSYAILSFFDEAMVYFNRSIELASQLPESSELTINRIFFSADSDNLFFKLASRVIANFNSNPDAAVALMNFINAEKFYKIILSIESHQARRDVYQQFLIPDSIFDAKLKGTPEYAKIRQLIRETLSDEEYLAVAEKFLDAGEYLKAVETCDELIKIVPTCVDAYDVRARANVDRMGTMNSGRKIPYLKAAVDFHLVLTLALPEDNILRTRANFFLGKFYHWLNCFDEAIEHFKQSLVFANDSERKNILIEQEKSIQEAKPRALTVIPAESSSVATTQLDEAFKFYNKKKYKIAIHCFDQYLKSHPESTRALFWRARCYSNINRGGKSVLDYELLLSIELINKKRGLNPDLTDKERKVIYSNLAVCYIHLFLYDPAIAFLNMSITKNPEYAVPYYFRGYCYKMKNDIIPAVEDLCKAVELKKSDYLKNVTPMLAEMLVKAIEGINAGTFTDRAFQQLFKNLPQAIWFDIVKTIQPNEMQINVFDKWLNDNSPAEYKKYLHSLRNAPPVPTSLSGRIFRQLFKSQQPDSKEFELRSLPRKDTSGMTLGSGGTSS